MALNEFNTNALGVNGGAQKIYSGTSTPPATGSGVTFNTGDWFIKTDPAASGAWLYVYTSGGWKSAGNLAS